MTHSFYFGISCSYQYAIHAKMYEKTKDQEIKTQVA
jgi:hypothetical protein